MVDRISLTLQPRTTVGKKVKRLRRSGTVPVHLYGPGITSRPFQCPSQGLIKVLAEAGRNTPVSVSIEGEAGEHLAFVREIQWDPINGELFHVDFLRAEATQRLSAEVPIVLDGESPGARQVSGTIVQLLRSIALEALPLDMPQDIRIDLSTLTEPDSSVRAGDIPLPSDTTLLTDPDGLVVRIEIARAEVVDEAAVEEVREETEAEEG